MIGWMRKSQKIRKVALLAAENKGINLNSLTIEYIAVDMDKNNKTANISHFKSIL